MSPPIAMTNPNLEEDPMALSEARAAMESIARRNLLADEMDVAGEKEEDEEDEDDDKDDDEDDDEDEDAEDDVPTDEEGYEIEKVQAVSRPGGIGSSNGGSDTDVDTHAAPNVSSDRIVPSTDAEPEGSLDRVKSAALGIQQIEDLEDDAKGG